MTGDKEDIFSENSEEDDDALWRYMMRDVQPLNQGKKKLKPKAPTEKNKTPPPAQNDYESPNHGFQAPIEKHPPMRPRKSTTQQIDRRTDERLRKGQMPIEARLDMHGMTRAQAHDALHRFALSAHNQGNRCVLVITGKGLENRDPLGRELGVLKNILPQWIKEGALKDIVLKAYPAKPKDGGSGAYYLLIKRKRG
ncbi:MAG: Smr/MutS family protein [Micavibrio sp.]|nr:Smr/MutS family protein [Micavibrio sp.]